MYRLAERDHRPAADRARSLKIGYVGGGSQGWAHTLINDLAQCEDLTGEVALYDVNHGLAARNAELGNQVMGREEAVGDWTFQAHREMDAALDDADFVICSTQDPPADTFVNDIDIPKEYGVYQPVADTVGPGGTMRGLRAIPQYREIAATVRERCPDAWVINYTNPMTVCTRTLYEEYPDINAIGLCHEVFQTQELFAELAETYVDAAEDVDRGDVEVTVKGINHFTAVDEAYWRGHDLFAYLDAELENRTPLPGYEPGDMEGESYWVNNFQIAFDLYDRFGVFGAAGDRHLAEFVPWYLAIDDPEEIQRWGIRLTPSSARVDDADGPDEMAQYLDGEETFEFSESGEEAVDIMRALLGEGQFVTHLNYPNEGQIAGLPTGAVVETNALLTGGGVTPLCAGELPDEFRSMVERHVTNQETLIEAGFTGDLDLAFQAFLNEPLVTLGREEARDLFADLVAAERDYLDGYDLDASVLRD
ncbi:glycoside hydrolase family 4 [Halorarum halophilum]|uniref:Glycoside hydrolase family 4 n=1 Tax=Halorarum halophilum TaxID=2743090 RepID=A0A7D5KNV6_9EURY|nr:glycoside hydrolase family 4 [Halobaculum halophilum]QLG28842.1 glycoside hydrolase family 4 [Halobaculum halophilum]